MVFRIGKKSETDWLAQAMLQQVVIDVTDEEIRGKMKMLGLTASDLQLLKVLKPYVQKEIDGIARNFYASFYEIEQLKQIIDQYSSVEKLSKTLAIHVMGFFSGVIDDTFLERRRRVGKMHYKIALKPAYYMGTFQNLQYSLIRIIFDTMKDPKIAEQFIHAVNKMLSFEQQIVMEAYDKEYANRLKKEYEGGRDDLRSAIAGVSSGLVDLSDQTGKTVRNLLNRFQTVRDSARSSSAEAQQVRTKALDGQKQLEQLLERVTDANRSIGEMGKLVENLKQSSQEIGRVTLLVKDISEQTNILALNSAIEAARAGEEGKGFTVVSREIGKLADETNKAMAQISDLVSQSGDVTAHVVASLNKTTAIIEQGMDESSQTGQKFQDIIASVETNSALISEIDNNIASLTEMTEKLGKGTETLHDSVNRLKQRL